MIDKHKCLDEIEPSSNTIKNIEYTLLNLNGKYETFNDSFNKICD